jgi:HD-like signal output (HDOD) protein
MTDVVPTTTSVESTPNPVPGAAAAAVLKRRALDALGKMPPFSPILNRLMATLAGDNVSFSVLGDLIEKDTVMAGNVLQLVNSALYARRGTVNSVRHALTLLGIEKVRNAVLGMSLTRMWSRVGTPRRWSMARFNMHAAASGVLSDLLAQRVRVDYAEGAFTSGLLHDLGQLLIALGLPEHYERITGPDRLASEREILGFTHAELSAAALAFWNLPQKIQNAVLYHHQPEEDPEKTAGTLTLSAVVAAANEAVNAAGVAIELGAEPGRSDVEAVSALGLSQEETAAVLKDFRAEYNAMTKFFRP